MQGVQCRPWLTPGKKEAADHPPSCLYVPAVAAVASWSACVDLARLQESRPPFPIPFALYSERRCPARGHGSVEKGDACIVVGRDGGHPPVATYAGLDLGIPSGIELLALVDAAAAAAMITRSALGLLAARKRS